MKELKRVDYNIMMHRYKIRKWLSSIDNNIYSLHFIGSIANLFIIIIGRNQFITF